MEAIAGQKNLGKGRLTTDRDYIADEVLQDHELTRDIFGHGVGIRNQLLHGIEIDNEQHGNVDYVSRIYDAIVGYFNRKHGTEINTDVIHPIRTLEGNFETWGGWVQPRNADVSLALKSLCEAFSRGEDDRSRSEFDKAFLMVDTPADY